MNEAGIFKFFAHMNIQSTGEVGGWLMAKCPLAPWKPAHLSGFDNSPSFGIKIEDDDVSFYNCFTCKSKGTVANLAFVLADYLDEQELKDYGKQIEREEILGAEADFGDWEVDKEVQTDPEDRNTNFPPFGGFYRTFGPCFSEPRATRYLIDRRFGFDEIVQAGLRYHERSERIVFPVFDHWTGRYAGCSGRIIWSEERRKREEARRANAGYENPSVPKVRDFKRLQKRSLLLHLGGHIRHTRQRVTWRGNRVKLSGFDRSYVIIVEGLFAYLRMVALGYGDCTYALLGSKLTIGKAAILKDIGKAVYWFVDNDPAGQVCLYGEEGKEHEGALAMLYGDVAQFIVTWPKGRTDPDELTISHVEHMIDHAELYTKPVDKRQGKSYGRPTSLTTLAASPLVPQLPGLKRTTW